MTNESNTSSTRTSTRIQLDEGDNKVRFYYFFRMYNTLLYVVKNNTQVKTDPAVVII